MKTHKILAYALALALAGARVHSQDWTLDTDSRVIDGTPALVTITVTPLSDAAGGPAGPGSVVSRYRYGERGQLLECVYFEDGRPVEYGRFTYDDALRLVTRVTRTAVSASTSSFSYAPGQSIEIVQPGASAAANWTQREQLRGPGAQEVYWVRSFDPNGTLTNASRTARDSRGRATETILYREDGGVDAIHTYGYADNVSREEIYDDQDNLTAILRSEYRYDAQGNWIERTTYAVDPKSPGGPPAPLLRTCRDIAFRAAGEAAPAGAASVEPRELFPRRVGPGVERP